MDTCTNFFYKKEERKDEGEEEEVERGQKRKEEAGKGKRLSFFIHRMGNSKLEAPRTWLRILI